LHLTPQRIGGSALVGWLWGMVNREFLAVRYPARSGGLFGRSINLGGVLLEPCRKES
jgi:hypothetical protein